LRSAAGGRDEETYSKYAGGIRKISIQAEGSTSSIVKDSVVVATVYCSLGPGRSLEMPEDYQECMPTAQRIVSMSDSLV
jgi:hypothetical protein